MDRAISNQFYLLIKGQEPILWNIYDTTPFSEPDLFWTYSDYCAKVLQTVEKSLNLKGLIFYITFDQIDELPSYGQNVVVVMTGDEGCHIPRYFHKVFAIFKPYGTSPFLGYNPFKHPSYLNFISLIQFFKTWLDRLPSLLNYWRNHLKLEIRRGKKNVNNIYTIPLGYYKQLELPIKTLESRFYDVFFAGSIFNDTYVRNSLKYWISKLIRSPKTLARQQMLSSLNLIEKKYPNVKTEVLITSGFFSNSTPDAKSYSEKIMNSKICLVPRGTSFETYRFFEAIRYGCIVISEALPAQWFYCGSPVIQVKNWKDLENVIEELIDNGKLMQMKHHETLNWWKNKCSPEATGQYIVEKLHSLRMDSLLE